MSTVSSAFQCFHSRIALDDSRVDRIKSEHEKLRERIQQDGPLAAKLKGCSCDGALLRSGRSRAVARISPTRRVAMVLVLSKWRSLSRWMVPQGYEWALDSSPLPQCVSGRKEARCSSCSGTELRRHGDVVNSEQAFPPTAQQSPRRDLVASPALHEPWRWLRPPP